LATFNNTDWVPIAWGQLLNDSVQFHQIGNNIIYLLGRYENGTLIPIHPPFILHPSGDVEYLEPDRNRVQTIRVYRKYQKGENIKRYSGLLQDGALQWATTPDFNSAHTIYKFKDSTSVNYQIITPSQPVSSRYIRFMAGANKYGGEIAELEVYDTDLRRVKGHSIGTESCEKDHGLDQAFDGKVLTYFKTKQSDGGWCGLDLGQVVNIGQIRILPHNDDNFIRIGEEYELFFWENSWKSVGIQIGTEMQYLDFQNVPSNALYLLKNNTSGKEERIFTYQNNTQVWW
jgi:hypothetical protein